MQCGYAETWRAFILNIFSMAEHIRVFLLAKSLSAFKFETESPDLIEMNWNGVPAPKVQLLAIDLRVKSGARIKAFNLHYVTASQGSEQTLT